MPVPPDVIERVRQAGWAKPALLPRCALSAAEDLALAESAGLRVGELVIDVGCGYGRLALAFAASPYAYLGVDVSEKRLAAARRAFAVYPVCSFMRVDVVNGRYNFKGSVDPSDFQLPLCDGGAAAVFAVSLFTHMPDMEHVRCYLREFRRLLRAGGLLVTTWLTSPPCSPDSGCRRSVHVADAVRAALAATGFDVAAEEGEGSLESHLRLTALARA
jgi:SAM-dependent methyltransferase